jgi:hypothetical protein
MNRLPKEILPLIAQHLEQRDLYQCVLVNRQFYGYMTPCLWHNIKLTSEISVIRFFENLHNNQQPVEFSLGQYICELHLELSDWVDQEKSRVENRPCVSTFGVVLEKSTIATGLQLVATHCHQLKALLLARMPIARSSLVFMAQHLNQLSTLCLLGCPRLPHDLATIFNNLPLKRLFLASPDDPSPYDFLPEYYDDTEQNGQNLVVDLTGFPQLTLLQLHGTHIIKLLTFALNQINNNNTSGGWPHLTSLILEASLNIQDVDIIPLFTSFPAIKYLKITETQLTDIFFDAVTILLPGILEIDVSYCHGYTPAGFRRLVRGCPQLTLVTLAYCNIWMNAFPEAGAHCYGPIIMGNQVLIGLHRLDQEAIDKIRLGIA